MTSILKFWIMRWLRTLPAYFFFLILLVAIYTLFDRNFSFSNNHIYLYFLFLQNLFQPKISIFSESWSLSIEEWFYFLFPIIIYIIYKIIKSKKHAIIFCILIMILVPTIIRCFKFYYSDETIDLIFWDSEFRRIVFTRLDSIAWGILGAYISFFYQNLWAKHSKITFLFGIMIITIVVLLRDTDFHTFYRTIIYFPFSAIGILLTFPLLSNYKLNKGFIHFIITYISIISYSLYLINYSFLREFLIEDVFQNKIFTHSNLSLMKIVGIKYFLYWVLLFILSHFSFLFIELPFINKRKKVIKFFKL